MTTSNIPTSHRSMPVRVLLVITTVIAVLVGGLSPAQALSTISGKVVAAAGGAAMADVAVELQTRQTDDDGYSYWGTVDEGSTNSAGQYVFTGRAAGRYRIAAVRDGFVDVTLDVTANGSSAPAIPDIRLIVAARIGGLVTNANGQPIPDIDVAAFQLLTEDDGEGGTYSSWDTVAYATTGSDGKYGLSRLPAGTYRIGFADWNEGRFVAEYFDNKPQVDSAGTKDFVVAAGQVEVADAQLASAGRVTGAVTGPGASTALVCVTAFARVGGSYDDVPDGFGLAGMDSSGHFVLGGLPAGTYKVRFEPCGESGLVAEYWNNKSTLATANEITVAAGKDTSGINAQLDAETTTPPVTAPPVVRPPAAVPPPLPAKGASSLSISAKGARKKVTLTITATAAGATPSGTVTIKLGAKTLKTVALKDGSAKVTVKKQKKGKRAYTVVYSGDPRVLGATAQSKKVKIG